MDPIAIQRMRPGEEGARAHLHQAASSHALGDEGAFIFGDCAADRQHQLVMGVLAHGTFQKLHLAAAAFECFPQDHWVDGVARQAIRSRDQDHIQLPIADAITQAIQSWPIQAGATAAIIAKNMGLGDSPLALLKGVLELIKLLFDGLGLSLVGRGNAEIQSNSHLGPPQAQLKW